MNNDYICTFVDCQYGLNISKVTQYLNTNLINRCGTQIQYIKTSTRNDAELTTVYRLRDTNVTYSFIICLPPENNNAFPGIYYSYHDDARYRVIEPGNIDAFKNKLKEQLVKINALDFNTYIRKLRSIYNKPWNEYCGNVWIRSVKDAEDYYNLYSMLLNLCNELEMGIYKLSSVQSPITAIKHKINDIRCCNDIKAQLNSIVAICKTVSENENFQDNTLKTWFNEIAKHIIDTLEPTVETVNKYQIISTANDYINSKCIDDIITRYLGKSSIPKYSLKNLIKTLDRYHETCPIPPVHDSKDKHPVLLSQYSSIYIPYDKEYEWIDYNIHYKYIVNIDNVYWTDKNDKLVEINTINKTTTLNPKNKIKLTRDLTNLDQGNEEQWIVAINSNAKPQNKTLQSEEYDSNAIQFILSYNEFLHLEPNTTPNINLRTQK